MMKRITAFSLALILAVVCCVGTAFAANGGVSSPMSSPTITMKSAYLSAGDDPGEVDVEFNITATGNASQLGVSSIVIHKPDGSTYTVLGSVGNHFIGSGLIHGSMYTYKGESGKSYYAEVTFFATIGSVTDSKTVVTKSITAP